VNITWAFVLVENVNSTFRFSFLLIIAVCKEINKKIDIIDFLPRLNG
jgi:hypothetical protein